MMEILIIGINPYNIKPGGIAAYERNLIYGMKEHNINMEWFNNNIKINTQYEIFDPNSMRNKNISGFKFLYLLLFKLINHDMNRHSIIHTQRPDSLLPFFLLNFKNPKVCTLHGQNSRGITLKKGKFIGTIYKFIESFTLSRTEAIIAVDESTKKYYENLFPELRNRINVIPVGINLQVFKPLDVLKVRQKYKFNLNDKIILYLGRFEPEKNLELVIKSFAELKKEVSYGKLVLVGEGREKGRIKELIVDMDLKDVYIIDTLVPSLVPEILNCADVLIITSKYESGPLVALESMACGIPVVTTDVGRVREFIKNEFVGKIVEYDEKKIAFAIKELLFADRNKINKACRDTALDFSFDTTIKKTLDIYKKLV